MNLFGQLTVHHPHPNQLRIERDQGLFLTLFMLVYFGFVAGMNALFFVMFLDAQSPYRLTCRSQQQKVNCEYVASGLLSGKRIQIKDVRSAIASQKPQGEIIVLTTSQPWVALEQTSNNAENIAQINRALVQLRQGGQWQLEMQPTAGLGASVLFFFGPIGLLFLSLGIILLLTYCSANFEFDRKHNTITITKLGLVRSHPATFDQLIEADRKPLGYLGALSDQFGVYGGDEADRHHGREIVRLVIAGRRPLTLTQTLRPGEAAHIVSSINTFIAQRQV